MLEIKRVCIGAVLRKRVNSLYPARINQSCHGNVTAVQVNQTLIAIQSVIVGIFRLRLLKTSATKLETMEAKVH